MMRESFVATAEEYHASPGVSNSMLGVFLEDPKLYYHYFVAGDWERPAPTPEMIFGTNVHSILPPANVDDLICEIPLTALSKSGHKKGKEWTKFKLANADKILLKASELEPYRALVENVEKHCYGHLVAKPDHAEYNVRWRDPFSGLGLKARLDRVCHEQRIIVDIKTTDAVDEQSFANTIAKFGYHRQAAFYREAMFRLTGEEYLFVFCAVQKTRPYSVRFFELDEAFMSLGDKLNKDGLRRLAETLAGARGKDDWVHTDHKYIITLSQPKWLSYVDEWTV